jgi:hypothetical protein
MHHAVTQSLIAEKSGRSFLPFKADLLFIISFYPPFSSSSLGYSS